MLARISRIFEQLNNAWDVLHTMTPSEYTRFPEKLGQSHSLRIWPLHLDTMVGHFESVEVQNQCRTIYFGANYELGQTALQLKSHFR